MKPTVLRLLAVAAATPLACVASAALALSQRTFVASFGSDANLCTIAAPCRGFAAAIAQTSPGGEVIVLDSAGYGPFTISGKDVSVIAPLGVYAGISVASAGGTGIAIVGNTAHVKLKGLTLTGLTNSGTTAIHWGTPNAAVSVLEIERCAISGFQTGLGGTVRIMRLAITDSDFQGNALRAIDVSVGSSAVADIIVERTRFRGNGDNSTGGAIATSTAFSGADLRVIDSSFVGNTPFTIQMQATASGFTSNALIQRSEISASGLDFKFAQAPGVDNNLDLQIISSTLRENIELDASGGTMQVAVRDSVFGSKVLANVTGTAVLRASVASSTFTDSRLVAALGDSASARIDVMDSSFSGGISNGAAIDLAHAGTAGSIRATIVGNVMRGFTNGVKVGDRTQAYVSRNAVTSSAQGFVAVGNGEIRSLVDNLSTANSSPDSAATTLTPY